MRSLTSATILTRFNKQLNKASIYGALVSALLLAGCGGSGGGSSDTDPKPATNNLLEAVDPGIFSADIERPSGSSSDSAIALLSPSGRVIFWYNIDGVTAITSAEINFDQDGSFSGSGTDIFYSGDKWVQNDGNLEGEAVSKSVIEGEAKTTSDKRLSSFTLSRNRAISAQGASLDAVGGKTYEQTSGENANVVTIQKNGALTGSDNNTGCALNGNVSVPDERFNVYEVSFDATSCDDASDTAADLRNGAYTGLAWYDQDPGRLYIIVENGEVTRVFSGL